MGQRIAGSDFARCVAQLTSCSTETALRKLRLREDFGGKFTHRVFYDPHLRRGKERPRSGPSSYQRSRILRGDAGDALPINRSAYS